MVYIYALQLKQGKYYIGKTLNPNFRIERHFNSEGAEWTKTYNPVKILEIIPNCDDYDEDKYTKIYMDKYGIDNVRGGSYTSIKLDKETKKHLEKNSNSTNDRCFKCGKEGHFAINCPETKSFINNRKSSVKSCVINKSDVKCYVCGKNDHQKEECKSIYWHCSKCYKEFDTKTSCINHEHNCKNVVIHDMCKKQNINQPISNNISFDNLLTMSPAIMKKNIQNLETINNLKFYKIKVGDLVLNYDVDEYNTLKEIIDDVNKIMNYTEKDLIKNPNINSEQAKTIDKKEYVKLMKVRFYDDISKLLGLLTEEICCSVQNGISFQEIEKNISI
jgi:hypothetical protein